MTILTLFKYVPLSVLRALALFVAFVLTNLPNHNLKRIIDINLRLAYPHLNQSQRHLLRKDIIRNQSLSSVESLKCWSMPPQWSIDQIHSVYNQNVLDTALNNPNGMLAIVPHLGTWEIMNAWLNQFGSPTIMFKPIKNKLANDIVLQGRERLNATLVPTDATGVKAIFKTLKQGGFSIILPDHVPAPSGGVNVPFFGVTTLTSTLAPKLASKTKCAMVGLICVRRGTKDVDIDKNSYNRGLNTALNDNVNLRPRVINEHGQFDIHCVSLSDAKLYSKDTIIATKALNESLENMINAFPSHYLWGYKRFKNMPIIQNPYKLTHNDLEQYLASRPKPD